MIFHVRSKFTAVGRREILTFFYIYSLLTVISLVLDAGVLQATNSGAYPWFVAVQNGLTSALCTSLLINGFVGFQLYEDGTTLSVWLLRLGSLLMFVITFAVSLLTFKGWAGLSPTNTTGLFVVLYIINAICVAVYFVMQIILVANTLQDRWPLGDLAFGGLFFVAGQVILYVFAEKICEGVSHYLDGLFFATVCNLLGVMMVYKVSGGCSTNLASTLANLSFSTGTVSPKKISSLASAPSRGTGMLRILCSNPPRTIEPVSMVVTASMIRAAWNTNLNPSNQWAEIRTPATTPQLMPGQGYSMVIYDSSWARTRILNHSLQIIGIERENMLIERFRYLKTLIIRKQIDDLGQVDRLTSMGHLSRRNRSYNITAVSFGAILTDQMLR